MGRSRRRVVGPAAAVAAVAALAGVLAAAALAERSLPPPVRTTVVVTDSTFRVSQLSMLEGVVTFVATNRGRKAHVLAIRGPALSMRTPRIDAGKTARLTVLLRQGRYWLWDPLVLGASKRQVLDVKRPPKVIDPSVIRPAPTGPGWDPNAYWDCAMDLDDERC